LLLGVKLNRNTYIHALDELLDIPDRLVEPIPLKIIDHNGCEHTVNFRKHGNTGSEEYEKYREAFEKAGAMTNASLGNAEVGIVSARISTEVLKEILTK
jgi:aminoglycoside 3-N-acetyltransferase